MISHSFTKSVNNFLKKFKEENILKLQNHFYMLEKEFDKLIVMLKKQELEHFEHPLVILKLVKTITQKI